ncbi:MAG: DNA repair protein RecO [Legionella sp.]|nr:DNA repair protein RecO [Legionella sp.]
MIRSLEALVLHKQWQGDTSARVSLFTRESGLVHCFCKAGRTPKKQALLQAFGPLWISLNERYEPAYIQAVESRESPMELLGDALLSGLYINELLYYSLSAMNPEPELFDAYMVTLKSLVLSEHRTSIEVLLRRFEWILLSVCGYSFSLTQEAKTAACILPNAYYQFIAGEGFVSATQGIPGSHVIALAAGNLGESKFLHSAKMIMRQAIDHLVGGREIKARALYRI